MSKVVIEHMIGDLESLGYNGFCRKYTIKGLREYVGFCMCLLHQKDLLENNTLNGKEIDKK